MEGGLNIVEKMVTQTIPKKKKCKKAKWFSEEALQIAEKRREVKDKGDEEIYTYLNAEFQRIARRDKKAYLSDPCKEIEENNRMRKTRDFFKKIKCKQVKWLSEKSLLIAEKRIEEKGKGEKIYLSECRVPKNRKERKETLPQ